MLTKSFKLGRLFGIDIRIDYSWFIILILITSTLALNKFALQFPQLPFVFHWILGLFTAVLFFGSVLTHELAHGLYAKYKGVSVTNITLFIFGGAAQIANEPKQPEDEFVMSLLGPATSIGLAFVMAVIWKLSETLALSIPASIAFYLAAINLLLAFFNLIPGFPLDGGRILRSIIWGISRNLRLATQIASISGRIFAFFFIILGVTVIFNAGAFLEGVWLIIIGWFLLNAATRSYQQHKLHELVQHYSLNDIITTAFYKVPPSMTINQLLQGPIIATGQQVFPIYDGQSLVGIADIEQIKHIPKPQWEFTALASLMRPLEQSIKANLQDPILTVLQLFSQTKVNQVPVVDDGNLVGLASKQRVINLIQTRTNLKF
ncbi:site-2 protease family protein [candidate division KSB1 bacterium]|nr:site-2 protease family protein [candidate division KSB1 bacterium]